MSGSSARPTRRLVWAAAVPTAETESSSASARRRKYAIIEPPIVRAPLVARSSTGENSRWREARDRLGLRAEGDRNGKRGRKARGPIGRHVLGPARPGRTDAIWPHLRAGRSVARQGRDRADPRA